ncbi:MAG: CotH kinase family protein, partial [bacterium]
MNKIIILFFALLTFRSFEATAQSGDVVFDGLKVHTVNIQFSQTNYWDSLTIYYNQGLEQYLRAAVIINGVFYDSVGIRFKGNSTFSHPNNKKPFKISMDEYIDDRLFDGMKSLTLNNCYLDPTFIREKIHLDFCREAGIVAPRSNFVNLYINGQLWGFYSLVESVDKKFLTSRFDDNDGNLFKAVDAFGNPIVSDLKWYGSDPASYYNRYELKTNEEENDWTDLVSFLDTLNNNTNTARSLPTKANMTTFYKALAADIMFGNLDAYVSSGRNFHVYDLPATGKFEWIVWDVGLSFGAYPGGVTNIENMSLTYVGNAANRPMVSKVYNTPELKAEYLNTVCLLYNRYFSSARLFPKID